MLLTVANGHRDGRSCLDWAGLDSNGRCDSGSFESLRLNAASRSNPFWNSPTGAQSKENDGNHHDESEQQQEFREHSTRKRILLRSICQPTALFIRPLLTCIRPKAKRTFQPDAIREWTRLLQPHTADMGSMALLPHGRAGAGARAYVVMIRHDRETHHETVRISWNESLQMSMQRAMGRGRGRTRKIRHRSAR